MPCDTTSVSEIDGKKFNGPLFIAALRRLGATAMHDRYKTYSWAGGEVAAGSYDLRSGEFTFSESRMSGTSGQSAASITKIKQSYAAAIVETQAKRHGWTLKQTSPTKYELLKR